MNIDYAIKEFKDYTNNYLEYGKMIDLKINHTFRVMDLCEMLSKSLNLNEEEIYISKIIGLLHDIGRFEQWKEYKTFVDIQSIDHADYGVELLKREDFLRKFIKINKYDEIILNSIKYHNKYTIPNDLDKKEEMFAKIIRDADKIDILYLYTIKELELDIDENCFEEYVYNCLLNKKNIDRKLIHNKTDRLSIPLSFIYDINYEESIKYLKDNNYYDIIIDIYKEKTNNEKLKEQLENIRKVINNYEVNSYVRKKV